MIAAVASSRLYLRETISALETARRGADEDIAAAQGLLLEVNRTVPRVTVAAARVHAAEEAADVRIAAGVARLAREHRAALAAVVRDAARESAREKRASTMKSGAMDFATAAASAAAAEAEAKDLAAWAALNPAVKPAPTPGWVPNVGENVVITSTGMSGRVTVVSGTLVTVQAGPMAIKVNASDTELDTAVPKTKAPPAKARSMAGTQAAKRMDALLGGHRGVGAGGRKDSRAPVSSTNYGEYNYGFDDEDGDDDTPTLGDTVRIKKSGVVGRVVDADDQVLTIQAGKNLLKAPVGAVEYADRGSGVKGTGGGGGGGRSGGGGGAFGGAAENKGKKKKGGKSGSGLPRATQQQQQGKGQQKSSAPNSGGSSDGKTVDISSLMDKFRRK